MYSLRNQNKFNFLFFWYKTRASNKIKKRMLSSFQVSRKSIRRKPMNVTRDLLPCQRNEARRGQGSVSVDPRQGEPQRVFLRGRQTLIARAFEVVGGREGGSSVQQDLEDLVVVLVGGQDQGRDVRGVVGGNVVHGFPGIGLA